MASFDCVSPLHDQEGKFGTKCACAGDHNKKRSGRATVCVCANYFLCCGDVEMSPGTFDKDNLEPKSGNELQDGTISGTGVQPQALEL